MDLQSICYSAGSCTNHGISELEGEMSISMRIL